MNCSSHKFGKREMEEALHSKRLKYCSLNKGWISQAVGMTTEDDIVQGKRGTRVDIELGQNCCGGASVSWVGYVRNVEG